MMKSKKSKNFFLLYILISLTLSLFFFFFTQKNFVINFQFSFMNHLKNKIRTLIYLNPHYDVVTQFEKLLDVKK